MSRGWVVVWQHHNEMLSGLLNTMWISVLAAIASLILGAGLAMPLMSRHRPVVRVATTFVDVMRCVPFLLLAYIVYYGLPSLGLTLDNWSAGLSSLVLYNTGYMAELLVAAWRSLPVETIEAAHAFGFHGFAVFRRIILPPVLLNAAPMIGNQVIQIVKDSAFLTIIAVPELTHAAASIQSTYYVPFAAFVAAVLLYWLLCLGVEQLVGFTDALAEQRR